MSEQQSLVQQLEETKAHISSLESWAHGKFRNVFGGICLMTSLAEVLKIPTWRREEISDSPAAKTIIAADPEGAAFLSTEGSWPALCGINNIGGPGEEGHARLLGVLDKAIATARAEAEQLAQG